MYFREEIDKMREASFDFGKKPPVDGYTKVTEKSVYTKEKGFGLSAKFHIPYRYLPVRSSDGLFG